MSIMTPIPLYPRGGNLFGLPENRLGDEFNKILDAQFVSVNNNFTTSTPDLVIPITIPFDFPSELDIEVKFSVLASNSFGKHLLMIPNPDGSGTDTVFNSGTTALFTVSYLIGSKSINLKYNPSGGELVAAQVRILKRKRTVLNFALISYATGAPVLQTLPFNIVNPMKVWISPGSNTSIIPAAFVYNYITTPDVGQHLAGINPSNQAQAVRIENRNTARVVSLGASSFYLLEFK